MTKCHFCDKELPEEGCSHTIYCEGTMHRLSPGEGLPLYAVCLPCMKRLKLQPREIRREK